MLRALVRNTTLNLGAFGVMGVLGLLTVGWTVAAYGMHLYGIIAFARYLLPTGLIGLFDLGVPDAAARLVARADTRREARELGETVTATVLAGAVLGVLSGGALMLAAGPLSTRMLPLSVEEALQFRDILFWSGVATMPLMLGQAVEGVLKGMNRFRALRLAEVAGGVLFAGAVLWLTRRGASYVWIAYAFLATSVVRSLADVIWLFVLVSHGRWRPARPGRATLRALAESAWLLLQSKLASVTSTYLPSLLIGRLVGAAGVGTFDVLARIPRLVKVVVGVTTQALLRPAAILDAKQDDRMLGQLGITATYAMLAAVAPPLIGLALHTEVLLVQWLGAPYADLAPWLGVFLLWPLLLCTYQSSNAVLTVRLAALRPLNRANGLQVVAMVLLAVALSGVFDEKAFILSIVLCELLFLPYRISVYCRHTASNVGEYWAVIGRVLWPALPGAGLAALVRWVVPGDLAAPIAGFAAYCLAHWAALYVFGTAEDRSTVRRALAALPLSR